MKDLKIDSLENETKGHRIVYDKLHMKTPIMEHDVKGLHLGAGHKRMKEIELED